jgi:hypothetical protein
MALWIMTDFLPLINADKIYFYRICNITQQTVVHAAAAAAEVECATVMAEVECAEVAAAVVYSPLVAAAVADIHDCLYVCIDRATFL